MIVIVSSHAPERAAFAALCEAQAWPYAECDSFRAARKIFRQLRPQIILTRHKLVDGYSDDVIAGIERLGYFPTTKLIVLMSAGTSSALEARQVALGADCVQRDPVRTNVLAEYLAKYRNGLAAAPAALATPTEASFRFADVTVRPVERSLEHGAKRVHVTPREIQLLDILFDSRPSIVTYDVLYSQVLGRQFRGDTSNMRVLLGKLDSSFRSIDASLRRYIEVIPKTGYRYTRPGKE